MCRVAIVQHAPAFLDRAATLAKAVAALDEAAGAGAQLVVFPEAFVPGYPAWIWRLRPGGDMALTEELHARPGVRRLFRNLTLLWATALLGKAVVVLVLLETQPLATLVLAKAVLIPLTNATCIGLTVLIATAVARASQLPTAAPCPIRSVAGARSSSRARLRTGYLSASATRW